MSSITAAARMIRLAATFNRPMSASTWAVIPTEVATIAAPTNNDSTSVPPLHR